MRVLAVVLTAALLMSCTEDTARAPAVAPQAPPPASPTPFLDAVEEPGTDPTITEQAEEAQRRNEGGTIRRNNRGQPARTKRDHAEHTKRTL